MNKRLLRWIAAGAALGLLAASAPAQQAEEVPERVSPVFLDVVVLDSEGEMVSGLRADEFILYEDEIPHQVSVLEASASSAQRSARVNPFVLALAGEQAPASEAVMAAARAIRTQMGGGDQVCILRLGKDLRLVHPFSSQPEELVAALQSSEPGELLSAESGRGLESADGNPFATAESRLHLARQIQRLFYAAPIALRRTDESSYPALVQAAARALSAIQGRKTLLLLGAGQVSPVLPPAEVDRTFEVANAFHLAVYSQDEEARPKPPAEGRQVAPLRRGNRASPLRRIVHSTGGFTLQQGDLASQAERVFQEAHQHYRLNYRSRQQGLNGRYRELRLLTKRPGTEGRLRSGYPARPAGLELLNQSEIESLETIRQAEQSSPLEAFLRADVLPGQGVGQKTLVSLSIPSASLQFQDLEGEGRQGRICRIQTLALLRDASGAVLQTFGGPLAVSLDASRYAIVEKDGLAITRMLSLAPGEYFLEAGVLDELAGGGMWLQHKARVEAPQQGFALGPILLGQRDSLSVRGRDAAPLGVANFVPTARRAFEGVGGLSFVVQSRNVADAAQPEFQAFLENELGARSALKLENAEGQPLIAHGRVELSELSAGKYHLVVEASDPSSGAQAQARAPFEVASPEK